MPRQRRPFTPEQKVALLRLHLLEKKPASDICQEHNLAVNLFSLWQTQLFENGTAAFDNTGKRRKAAQVAPDRTIAALQDKRQRKNEVRAELLEEHVPLKKLTRPRLRPTRFTPKSSRFAQGKEGSGRGNERGTDEPSPSWDRTAVGWPFGPLRPTL
jgi:transposase